MAKLDGRERRKARIRKKISGSGERPRLTVFRSARESFEAECAQLRAQIAALGGSAD